MPNDVFQDFKHPYISTAKVHRLLCLELKKFSDKISQISTAIESARPGQSGIQALCKLHVSMEKTSLLLLHCSESSKLYLAITGDKILLRCEKIRNSLESCLSQIQNMVPSKLALQISRIVDDLRIATFTVESSEDEAGQVLLALLHQDIIASSRSANMEELKAFKLAALRLNITSPIAVLIEKRSLKKLLGKIHDTDTSKKKILNYFLYLARKYWKSIGPQASHLLVPPEEFKCPLSMGLMYDPVTIANGETFERLWIEKWFSEGHGTCPRTHTELFDLSMTTNFALKDLISKWCTENGITDINPYLHTSSSHRSLHKFSSSRSIASFGSSLEGLQLQVSNVSIRSSDTDNDLDSLGAIPEDGFDSDLPRMNENENLSRCQSSPNNDHGIDLCFLAKLSALPWTFRRNAVEDVKNRFNDNKGSHFMISTSYIQPLLKFLKDARYLCDSRAQRDCIELLLIFFRECRSEVPPLPKDAFGMLTSFLESEINEEIFAIVEMLSSQQYYKSEIVASGVLSSILRVLEDPISNYHLPAMRALGNFSAHTDIGHHIIYLGYIPKLVPFLDDLILADHCINIFKNLGNIEEGAIEIANTDNCIASIGELLELFTDEKQEVCMEVLLSLCYQSDDYCELVMQESILSSLHDISVSANSRGKLIATELLQLLKNVKDGHSQEGDTELHPDIVTDSAKTFTGKKSSRFFDGKFSIFSKKPSC